LEDLSKDGEKNEAKKKLEKKEKGRKK
jgi:hypothetical protein